MINNIFKRRTEHLYIAPEIPNGILIFFLIVSYVFVHTCIPVMAVAANWNTQFVYIAIDFFCALNFVSLSTRVILPSNNDMVHHFMCIVAYTDYICAL